ncbi:MAG: response regulator [Bacteroidales bacterium]|nr:response regulator [Bacteroidales bacterium]
MYLLITNSEGLIEGCSDECKDLNIQIGDSISKLFEINAAEELINNFKEIIQSKYNKTGKITIKHNRKEYHYKLTPININNQYQILITLDYDLKFDETPCKKYFEQLTQISFELLAIDDFTNPYRFIGEKISQLLPQCTIIINKYDNSNDLFINEFICSPINEIKQYLVELETNVKKICFSLPIEQKILATYGRLVEINKEDFLQANYFFNKDLLINLLGNIPIHSIYVMGFISRSMLLGNITLLIHQHEPNLSMLEPLINHTSLLIQKHLAQKQIEINSRFYETILNTTSELIFIVNNQDKVIFTNKALQNLLTKLNLPADVLHKNVNESFPFLNHKFIQYFYEAKNQKRTLFFESSTRINEHVIFCQTIISPLIEDLKEHFIVSIRDITEWVLSKREISYLTEINQIIIENLNEGILLIDENYNIIKCNRKFLESFNYNINDILSKNIFDLMPQNFRDQALKVLQGLFIEGKSFMHEFAFTQTDGSEKIFSEEIFPILEDGKVKYLIAITQDITEAKRKETELLKSKDEAETKERIKSTFIAAISHEIRTPLNSINGFASLLQNSSLTEEKKQHYIKQIHHSSTILSRLIDDLIDISKIESGNLSIVNESVFLYPIFQELYEQFIQELQIRQKSHLKLVFTNTPEDNIPFYTDVLRLKQIMANLISNAIKYTYHGEIKFGYSLLNNCIIFYVKDTGVGIKAEQLENLFQPFATISKDYTTSQRSLGLGLYIVKNIVEQMNGTLHVESEWQKGSTFSVRFPYSNTNLFTPQFVSLKNNKIELEKQICILIAEDDDLNFIFLEEMLANEKIKILRAHNGKEAVELFKKHHCVINIVLMDIQMPIMDGFEATKLIKELNPHVPIIAQTAYAYSTEEEQCRKAGCCEYLIKPLNQNDLIEKILQYI